MAPSGSADARTITPAARIGATSRPSNGVYHIWARRSDAHLTRLELDSDDDAYAIWADQMPLGTPAAVKPAGVDGISWTNAGGQEEEHVAFVGEDNKIYDWRLINGAISFAQYLSVPAPGGEVLTGQIAIGRRQDHVFFFASTQLGRIYFWDVTNWNGGNYTRTGPIAGVSTTAMISSTGPWDGAYVRVFFSGTNNNVYQYKYDGAAWTSVNFAGPGAPGAPNPADRPPRQCDLGAATEGQIGASAGYRTYLFCTRAGGSPHYTTLYYRYASNSGGTNFGAGWSTKVVPTGAVATSGFGLTARRRAEGGAYTLDAFLLGSVATFHVEHTANAASIGSVTSLGWDGETSARPGGLVAAGRESRGYSDAFFVGQGQQASWLYRKIEDDDATGFPAEWINYGPDQGWKTYRAGVAGTRSPSESSTAVLGGRILSAAMYRDSTGDSGNRILWSQNEGDTVTGPTTLTVPPGVLPYWLDPGQPDPSWAPGFDPVTDFDDQGKGYVVELRSTFQTDGSPGGRGLVLWSTSAANGTPTFETQIFGSTTEKSDHPWIAIYRNPSGLDQVHIAWQIEDTGPLYYTHADVNHLSDLAANIVDVQSGGIDIGLPRITVSQFDGTAYVVWPHGICRVQADGACAGLLAFGDLYTPSSASSDAGSELQFPHTINTFRAVRCFSAVADPSNSNTVYYAFQRREAGVAEGYGPMNLWVARLAYAFGAIDPGPRIPLGASDDGMHQTLPELTVSQDGPTARMILATWYDWNNVNCTIGGVEYDGSDWLHSACYEVRMATSSDLGVSWNTVPHVFPTISDPGLLPQRLPGQPSPERFLGDYHAVSGDLLHSVHVAITAPVGGADQVTNVERGWFSHGSHYNAN